jgi:P3 major capsid protein
MNMATTAAPQKANPQQANLMARQLVIANGLKRTQLISTQTVSPASNPTLNIQPRPVGLGTKFFIEIIGTLTNGAGGTSTLTDTAVANMLQQVIFTDLQNNTRIQTTGLHLMLLAGMKRRHPYLGTADWNKAAGNNLANGVNVNPATWPVMTAPATLAANAVGTVRAVIEVPLAYSDDDLRGSVYLGVVNANANLQLTFNQNVFAGTNDYTNAVYQGQAGVFTSVTINVYQEYIDQLPTNQQGAVILPRLDIGTIYNLYNTNLNSVTAGQDFPIQYANFRSFLSLFVIYNSSGASAAGRAVGTDLNYLALASANATNIWKVDPLAQAQFAREVLMNDLPAGVYYINHRRKPIETLQYGNMQLVLNAITAAASAYANVYWESFQLINSISQAGSLAAS